MLILYLFIAFGFAWALWIPEALIVNDITNNQLVAYVANFSNYGAWGPLIAAIVVATKSQGRNGIKKLFKQTFNLNFRKKWFIPTLLLFPFIIGFPLLILRLFNQELPALTALHNPFVLPIAFIVILLTAGPLQEEYGWRGTMQAELQNKYSALISSLMVGFTWGLWHLPLFFLPSMGFYYDKPIWGLVFSTTLISVLFGWIYNNTNRNLLLMLLFHTSYNFSHYIFPSLESETASLLYMVLVTISVIFVVVKTGSNLKLKKVASSDTIKSHT